MELYRLARQRDRDGKEVQQVRVIKDMDGNVLTHSTGMMERWKKNCEELLNEENVGEHREEEVAVVEQ